MSYRNKSKGDLSQDHEMMWLRIGPDVAQPLKWLCRESLKIA